MNVEARDSEHRPKSLTDLMIEVIQSRHTGNHLVEAAAELIAEDSRFNVWTYTRKSRSTTPEMWNMAAFSNRINQACVAAWDKYLSTEDRNAFHDELMGTLRSARDQLRTARVNDRVDFEDPDMPDELHSWD